MFCNWQLHKDYQKNLKLKLLFDICGFETQDAPSVASYYDLLSRLWLSSHREHIRKKSKTRKFHPKPSKKLKANQKLPNKRSGIVNRLVNRLINANLPRSRPEEILQKFLARCVVDYSGKLGLLGNTSSGSPPYKVAPSRFISFILLLIYDIMLSAVFAFIYLGTTAKDRYMLSNTYGFVNLLFHSFFVIFRLISLCFVQFKLHSFTLIFEFL